MFAVVLPLPPIRSPGCCEAFRIQTLFSSDVNTTRSTRWLLGYFKTMVDRFGYAHCLLAAKKVVSRFFFSFAVLPVTIAYLPFPGMLTFSASTMICLPQALHLLITSGGMAERFLKPDGRNHDLSGSRRRILSSMLSSTQPQHLNAFFLTIATVVLVIVAHLLHLTFTSDDVK